MECAKNLLMGRKLKQATTKKKKTHKTSKEIIDLKRREWAETWHTQVLVCVCSHSVWACGRVIFFFFFSVLLRAPSLFFSTADLLFLRWNSFWWLTSNLHWCILKGHIPPTNVEIFHFSKSFQRGVESTWASDSAAFAQSRAIWKKNGDTAGLKASRAAERRARCPTTHSALLAPRSICQTDGVCFRSIYHCV